ncbi:MAG: tRNA (adenosine(37)-N6)-threonylcarbamoyltransferase complex ATPase subunit type 1 TsaE [Gammaproteobacteria bacterium]|nr:tRNA (adenosine(37)-N6)-threonylcarbamoyltransferase complex ATPase subunit type 1 TsaE [Gammaproteobacteria bacterium]
MRLTAGSADETRAIGARLAAALVGVDEAGPLVIGLSGDLGAGKTTLVGGLLEALGHEGPVRSPTYTLVEPYLLAGRDVNHCDLYRLRDPSELDDLGLRDLLTARSLLLVEWPERAGDRLGTPDLSLRLGYCDGGRSVDLDAATEPGRQVLSRLSSHRT